MKKKVLISLIFAFMLSGYFLSSRQIMAKDDPIEDYCWFNEAILDCDTGGMWVCYGVHPPDCQ